jgi:hypothetical protein
MCPRRRRAGVRRVWGQRGPDEQRTSSEMGMKTTQQPITQVGIEAFDRHTPIELAEPQPSQLLRYL